MIHVLDKQYFIYFVLNQIDVLGFMHFWGLTIDVVSSIIVIISIGLCVDYSAHIASTFLNVRGMAMSILPMKII